MEIFTWGWLGSRRWWGICGVVKAVGSVRYGRWGLIGSEALFDEITYNLTHIDTGRSSTEIWSLSLKILWPEDLPTT